MSVELENLEGEESDVIGFEDFEELREMLESVESTPEESAFMEKFEAFFATLNAKHFQAKEFLFMGGSHYGSGRCGGKNTFPPEEVWGSLKTLVPVIDTIRAELGHSIRVTSIYRSPAYNSCIGGVTNSQHRKMTAADCVVRSVTPKDLHKVAKKVRDRGDFKGGIGLYRGFVHIDVRGHNADWGG